MSFEEGEEENKGKGGNVQEMFFDSPNLTRRRRRSIETNVTKNPTPVKKKRKSVQITPLLLLLRGKQKRTKHEHHQKLLSRIQIHPPKHRHRKNHHDQIQNNIPTGRSPRLRINIVASTRTTFIPVFPCLCESPKEKKLVTTQINE